MYCQFKHNSDFWSSKVWAFWQLGTTPRNRSIAWLLFCPRCPPQRFSLATWPEVCGEKETIRNLFAIATMKIDWTLIILEECRTFQFTWYVSWFVRRPTMCCFVLLFLPYDLWLATCNSYLYWGHLKSIKKHRKATTCKKHGVKPLNAGCGTQKSEGDMWLLKLPFFDMCCNDTTQFPLLHSLVRI